MNKITLIFCIFFLWTCGGGGDKTTGPVVPDVPVVENINVTTLEDTQVPITLLSNQTSSTFAITGNPQNGTMVVNGNTAIYTPIPNYFGTDIISYIATSTAGNSNIGVITITINPVNDAPVANDIVNQVTDENRIIQLDITLDAVDVEGDDLSYSLDSSNNGSVTISGSTATYTPNQDWNGTDTFAYKANDGELDSNIGTVTITVEAVNDAPVTENQTASTDEDTAVEITLTSSDIEGDTVTYSIVSDVSNGSTSISGTTVTFTPAADWNGTDTFTFKANDGILDSNISTVSVTVSAVNDAPVAEDNNVNTNENKMMQLDINLVASDIDGDNLTYTIVSDVASGSASLTGNTVTYTPNQDWHGSDGFTFKANDGTLDSNIATIVIGVIPVNDAPSVENMSVKTEEDIPLSFKFSYTEIENDNLTFSIVTQPSNGVIAIDEAIATYTPNTDWNGTDTFTYKANDGALDSNIGTVSVIINSINDIPIANDISLSTDEDIVINGVSLSGTDVDGDNLTYSIVTAPLNASIAFVVSNVISYTPNTNWNGTDTFTYKANDGTSDSSNATITITVNAINDNPTTSDVNISIDEDSIASINLEASDIESEASSLTVSVSSASNGTVSISDLIATYTPNANFNGTDTFTYTVNDGSKNSNASTATIYINPMQDVPVFTSQSYTYDYGTTDYNADTLFYALDRTDVDGEIIDWAIVGESSPDGAFSLIETSNIDTLIYVNPLTLKSSSGSENAILLGTDSNGNAGIEGSLSVTYRGGSNGLMRVMEMEPDWYFLNSDTNNLENAAGIRDAAVSYVPFASLGRTGYIVEHRAGDIDGDGLGDVNNAPFQRDFDRFNYWTEQSIYDIELNFSETSIAWDYINEYTVGRVPFAAYVINNFTQERMRLYAGFWDKNTNQTFEIDGANWLGPVYSAASWEPIYLFWSADESNSYDPAKEAQYLAEDDLTTSGGCGWANSTCVESYGGQAIQYPFMTATLITDYLGSGVLPTAAGHAAWGSGYTTGSAIIFDTYFDKLDGTRQDIQNNLIQQIKEFQENEIIPSK